MSTVTALGAVPAQRDSASWLPGIEILRGVAALSVVFHHMWSLGTMPRFTGYWVVEGFGTWGVSLFFVLSGFLLADHFWRGEPEGRLRRFYVRRFFRIAPAYYVNVAFLFLFFASHTLLFSTAGAKQVATNFTFTQYLFPNTSSNLNVNGALWTLTIEAILYLTLPVLSWFTKVTRGYGAAVLIAIGLAYRFYVARFGAALEGQYFNDEFPSGIARLFLARQFLGVLPLFGVGLGLKWLVYTEKLRWPWPRATRRMGATAIAVVAVLLPSLAWLVFIERSSNYTRWVWFTGFELILGLLFVPVLLFCASPTSARPTVPSIDRVGVWIGERSYGLYLWHFPIILAVYGRGPFINPPPDGMWLQRVALILVLALAAAEFSWRSVERPAQAFARRITSGASTRTAHSAGLDGTLSPAVTTE